MAIGAPAKSIGGEFFEHYNRSRERAIEHSRYRLAKALHIQREMRANAEAIARHTAEINRQRALFTQAQDELAILQRRETEIQASPGMPYRRGAATGGKIFEAQDKLEEAQRRVGNAQTELDRLAIQRDERVRGGAIPAPERAWYDPRAKDPDTPISELPGASAAHPYERKPGEIPFGPTPYKKAVAEHETADTEENRAFRGAMREKYELLDPNLSTSAVSDVQKEQAKIHGLEEEEKRGQFDQAQINEIERQKQLASLQEREAVYRGQEAEAQGGLAAAAAELAARQNEQQAIRGEQVPQAGGGGLLGIIGALVNKAGGAGGGPMGSPGGGTSGGGGFGGKGGATAQPQTPPGGARTPPTGQHFTPPQFGPQGAPTPSSRPEEPTAATAGDTPAAAAADHPAATSRGNAGRAGGGHSTAGRSAARHAATWRDTNATA